MIINSPTLPLYGTHGINGIFGIIGTNGRVFNSPNNTNSTNNTHKPCYGLLGTIGRKAARQSHPFALFVLSGSAGKRWTGSPLFSPRESTRLSASLSSLEAQGTPNLCRMNRLINEF